MAIDHAFLAMNAPALLLLLAVGVMLVLARRSARLPAFPGQRSFIGLLVSAAWWALTAALENLAVGLPAKVFWSQMAWLGIVATPLFWLHFIWTYIHGGPLLGRRWRWTAALLAVGTWVIALTNDAHHLMYLDIAPVAATAGAPMRYVHGFWFYVVTLALYVVMLASVVLVLNELPRASALHRRHHLGFLAAMALPWAGNIGHVTGTLRIFGFDPTPFTFLVMGAIFYWLVSRRQLFDLLPIARNTLVDAIPDPVLVLDGNRTIVEANAAALRLEGMRPGVGARLSDLPALREALAPLLASRAGMLQDTRIGAGTDHFDVSRVPLSQGGREVGELLLFRDVTRRRLSEMRLHETLGALERQLERNVQQQQQLRRQATQDSLTGLFNRHLFEEMRDAMLAEARASGQPLSAVMIDLDCFKRLNDTRGHRAGDEVLRTVGGFLLARVRQSDTVFRVGGEEILVALPGMPAAQAVTRIENWRREFAATTIAVDGEAFRATFSAGVATFPEDATTWETLLHRADQALYHAKAAGRNRIAAWRQIATAEVD